MPTYIHQWPSWPHFTWDKDIIAPLLADVKYRQGRLLGRMEGLGFTLKEEANLQTLTIDVIKSSEIEGEILNPEQVRSSIAKRLGLDVAGIVEVIDRNVEGVVEMMLDATQHYQELLTDERLFGWHAALFPSGRSGMYKIVTGQYRNNQKEDPMQVVSGALGREQVHFEAPGSEKLEQEMKLFLHWLNHETRTDAILKAAVAHLWFVTIHPFDDGNGRIARAITDMLLSRADMNPQRFYSMSSQIRAERKAYYDILESTQKDDLDITGWLQWFLNCLTKALENTAETLASVLKKARFWEILATVNLNDRQRKMLNLMLDNFEGKITSAKWAKITRSSQDTAGRDINDLLVKGVLLKENAGGRSTSYLLATL